MQELGVETSPHLNCPRCYAVFLNRFQVCPLDGAALSEMRKDLLIGKVIAGRYLVEAFVGEGGMGRVYRARHTALSRRFAIKILFGEYAAEEKARARFAREAEAASRLDHPNVVPVLDYGETATRLPYLAMDFVEGRDLLAILDRERRLPLPRVLRLAKDMCRGLAHAHARGLVHRDFKPGNVLIVEDHGREVPRIADFGLAIDPGDVSSRLTTGRIIFGSPAYMSPEQASQGELDARSDQFSLGVTLYEMITGRLPFAGSAIDQLTQNASAPRPLLAAADPALGVPQSMERLVHKLMAIWPNGRYTGMDAVIVELERVEGELTSGQVVTTARTPMLTSDDQSAVVTGAGEALAHTSGPRPRPVTEPASSTTATSPTMSGPGPAQAPPSVLPRSESKILTHLVSRRGAGGDPEVEAQRRRRLLWLGVAAVALLGAGIGVYVGTSGHRTHPPIVISGVTLPVVDAGVAHAVPADAAPVVATVNAPDAAVSTRPPANDHVKRRPRPQVVTTVKPKPPVEKPPVEKPPVEKPPVEKPPVEPAPPTGEVTAKGFTNYYKQVGSALERLRQQKGEDAAAPFRVRYFAIPLNDALRTPALRVDAMKKLGALEHDIRAALR